MPALKLNTEYVLSSGAFWAIYGIAGSFASVFMLAKGYTNTQIGIMFAAANLLGMILQPIVADRMDRTKGIKLIDAMALLTAVMLLSGAGFFFFRDGSFMLASVLVIILALHTVLQPLSNTLAFRLGECGVRVNYGIGRAGGSLGFSVILAVLGTLVGKKGIMSVPVCAEAACALFILLLLITRISYMRIMKASGLRDPGAADGAAAAGAGRTDERIDIRTFISRNKYFCIMNLGIAGLIFSNSILSNYMAQIAASVGGTTEQLGRILSLMAFLEIPTMVCYERIQKRFRSRTLIGIASVGFTAKIVVTWLARSVGMLFFSQLFQVFAFALLMPAIVYFTDEIMSPGEAVKGQALFPMTCALATIMGSLAGGRILDVSGVKMLTGIAALITAAGAAVVILSVNKVKDHGRLSAG